MNCKDRAMGYLSRKMRTEKELFKYLKECGYSLEEISSCVVWLKEEGYIDDVNYAVEFINYSIEKGRGKGRIAADLKEKGLSSETIEDGYFAYEEQFGAIENVEEKLNEMAVYFFKDKDINEKTKGRFCRKMYRRGFSYNQIISAINYAEVTNTKAGDTD